MSDAPLNQPKTKTIEEPTEMLTSLSFLKEGATFPPASQVERMNRYKLHKKKFSNKLTIDKKTYQKVIQLVDNRFRVITYKMLVNIYRKVSYRTADFLFVERPLYTTDEEKQPLLTEIVKLSKMGKIGHEGAIDVSRMGDAIYVIKIPAVAPATEGEEAQQGKARLSITTPQHWFPVVSERDLKEITHHVLAHVVSRMVKDEDDKMITKRYLIYQIHERGKYTIGEQELKEDNTLGAKRKYITEGEDKEQEVFDTGLSGFAVHPTYGVTTSDSIFGIDDYVDIIGMIDELQIRMEMISHVLDKHSDPTMSGPLSALEKDEKSGEYSVKLGGYLARENKDDPDVKYLTWDGKLDSSFKFIELVFEILSILTEMGNAIFDKKGDIAGANISGRALKLMYVNPLTKVSRVRNNFDDVFKVALAMCSEVGYTGKPLTADDVGIEWRDGLPDDPKEKAEIAAIRVGDKATDTVESQIMKLDNVSKTKAEEKADQIQVETAQSMPAILSRNAGFESLIKGDETETETEEE